ncbi:MAG: hypothetical protein BWY68_00754 [bacterium ADurb.Bin400]|nr:MAG: hypothetical protein BWY68_00754 [bacterium ADurb.Bin400]
MKYKFCVSGTADAGICTEEVLRRVEQVGEEIVRQDGMLVTGATTGAPYRAAVGAKRAGGFVVGFSPAGSELEHVKKYRLPLDNHDVVVYTGFGYAGRNLLLTRSADAVIIVSGRIGTLNEFTIAFEDKKPIGVLTSTGGTADMIADLVKESRRGLGKIVYDDNPEALIKKLTELIDREKVVIGELEAFSVNEKLNVGTQ